VAYEAGVNCAISKQNYRMHDVYNLMMDHACLQFRHSVVTFTIARRLEQLRHSSTWIRPFPFAFVPAMNHIFIYTHTHKIE
jgi:hypothetical protein